MIILIGLIVSIAFTAICFISTENYISSCVIGTITMLYFLIYVNRAIKRKDEKITRFQECYQFINNFLISLNIKGHISGALASALDSQSEETRETLKSLDSNDAVDKVDYLNNYFKFDVYTLFVELVTLYSEEGGDIIQMSNYLLNQIRENEEYLVNAERMSKTSLIEFSILWTFSLFILVILKFSLDDFFKRIYRSNFYQISIVLIFIFALFSIHVAIKKVTNIQIKGWD